MQIKVNESGKRIDVFLLDEISLSRNQIQKAIKNKQVLVNGDEVKTNYVVKENDIIDFNYVEDPIEVKPKKMELDIVYEDDDVMVINKKNGVVVHPGNGNYTDTLVNGLMYYTDNLSESSFRPGIVHRIDAYTTGLIMIAKNSYAHDFLAEQLKNKTVTRKYIALVWGVINNDTGTIDAPIGRNKKDRKKMAVTDENSKKAITNFRVLERYKKATLIELKLETGRTHQLRVHMEYINHPVVNDPVYGNKKIINDFGQCLHAKELGFIHPTTKEYMHFDSELPSEFVDIINMFKEE